MSKEDERRIAEEARRSIFNTLEIGTGRIFGTSTMQQLGTFFTSSWNLDRESTYEWPAQDLSIQGSNEKFDNPELSERLRLAVENNNLRRRLANQEPKSTERVKITEPEPTPTRRERAFE